MILKDILMKILVSKTLTFNTVMLAVLSGVVAWLNTQGVSITEEQALKIAVFVIGAITPVGNIVLRFFTKKPLNEKSSLME